MAFSKLTKLELQIMEALWTGGPCCIRDIQETFPARKRPSYTTVQTTIYRLETKNAVRRIRKIGSAHIFETLITRSATQGRMIDELLSLIGGRSQPLMERLIESGKLTLEEVQEAERTLRELSRKGKPQ